MPVSVAPRTGCNRLWLRKTPGAHSYRRRPDEHFTDTLIPQITVYTGDHFQVGARGSDAPTVRYESEANLANAILREAVESDIDMAFVKKFPDDKLIAHAHVPS